MHEECLICKAKLEYLAEDEMMECAICGKSEPSKTRCIKGQTGTKEYTEEFGIITKTSAPVSDYSDTGAFLT